MIYKHDYQRMALDTDRMMITQCGSDYHDYSNDKLARIYIKWAEEYCPERLQEETDKGRIYVHIDERITEVSMRSGRSGTKCVILTLNTHLQ